MLFLTPLYLSNRGMNWVWKWSLIWISTTRSMIFIVCKFWIFCQKVSEFQKGQKGNFYEKIHFLHQFYVIIGVQNGYKSGVRLLFRHLEVWLSGNKIWLFWPKQPYLGYLKVILPDVEIINGHHFCTHFVPQLSHKIGVESEFSPKSCPFGLFKILTLFGEKSRICIQWKSYFW